MKLKLGNIIKKNYKNFCFLLISITDELLISSSFEIYKISFGLIKFNYLTLNENPRFLVLLLS